MATLPFSNAYFAKAYPVERLESLLDGIESALRYCGSVVGRVIDYVPGNIVDHEQRNDITEEGVDKATIDRPAASIAILPRPDTLH